MANFIDEFLLNKLL